MRILEVCVDLDGGGIDRYLLNYCSRIKDIRFDFAIVDNNKTGILEPEIEALGSRIYRIPRQSAGIKANYRALKKILTDNAYDAVHVHLGYKGALALLCAKNCGVRTRIVHAHIAYEQERFLQKCVRKVFTAACKLLATQLAACGVDAAKWVWGKGAYESGKVKIHNNAIDTERFRFSPTIRAQKRQELGLEAGTLAVGHVGRISLQKNQTRLLDIFSHMLALQPDAKLFVVGRGDTERDLKQKAARLGMEDKVVFLGVRSDVNELLNAFDVFVFPSLFEGLPFTLIETQCNGLPAISADTVTPFVKVSGQVQFLSLNDPDRLWAEQAVRAARQGHNANGYACVIDAGYDITTQARTLENYYKDSIRATKR